MEYKCAHCESILMNHEYQEKLPINAEISSDNCDHRTNSVQNPYQITDIAHFYIKDINPNIKRRLCISMCPGKKDKRWNRDLELDINAIKLNDIQVIVCLLEWSEMRMLGIIDYPEKIQKQGIYFYHLPIRDRGTLYQKELCVSIPIIINHLIDGDNVLVHCRGGLGRAGTICACCLCHFGFDSEKAIEIVRKQRPKAIQTKKQEDSIAQYYESLMHNFC